MNNKELLLFLFVFCFIPVLLPNINTDMLESLKYPKSLFWLLISITFLVIFIIKYIVNLKEDRKGLKDEEEEIDSK